MTMKRLQRLKTLAERQSVTIAIAESLTAGRIQAMLGGVSGISSIFLGGVTAYALSSKVLLLGVNRRHAKAVNCVSARVAREMARGAAKAFGANLAAATTGYAEPNAEWGVAVPYAHCCAWRNLPDGKTAIAESTIEGQTAWSRARMQAHVSDETIRLIFQCLLQDRDSTG